MPNTKIIYSLKVHIYLQGLGFKYIIEMQNPQYKWLNCWVYEETPDLMQALDTYFKEVQNNDKRI